MKSFSFGQRFYHLGDKESLLLLTFILMFCAIDSFAQTAILKDEKTIIFELPTTASRQLAILRAGTKVQILQNKNGWVQLRFGKNRTGWMPLDASSERKNSQRENPISTKENKHQINDKANSDLQQDSNLILEKSKGGLSFHLGFFGGGVGILTNVPVKSAGAKSISNMAFNYGIGIQ
ncbi:MAG: SH3 domain-containing protein [bacterium]